MNNSNLIFIDNTSEKNHNSIKNVAIGASEYQFYNLVNSFSKIIDNPVFCFNRSLENSYKIDNVLYSNNTNIRNHNFNKNDKIILQRFFPYEEYFRKKVSNCSVYLWIHDIPSMKLFLDNNDHLENYYNENIEFFKHYLIDNFLNNKNIKFVFNSYYCKQLFIDYLNSLELKIAENKLIVIYNILYENEFTSVANKTVSVNKNHIVYASAWQKGIEDVVHLFEKLLNKDNELILVLMNPGYGMDIYNDYKEELKAKFNDNIIIHEPLSKEKYSEVIKSSLCVLSSKFNETFGCIYAESYYLGVPVIADINCGAVKEIIDNNYIVDYNYPDIIFDKISDLKNNQENPITIKLHKKFLFKANFIKWISILQTN
jgi:glycosyltransferase involved in cell wall biosynthesis